MSKKIATHTLGCKTNQYDTQAMLEQFIRNDYEVVGFEDEANVYLINTCSVTAMADKKSRQFIRRARMHKDAIVLVCGCISQRDGEMPKELGADIVIGTSNRHLAYEKVTQYMGDTISTIEDVHDVAFEPLFVSSFDTTRALIKIQEGCNVYCAYCIIAGLRGNPRSRSIKDIEDEAKKLAQNGYKEAVLTGTNLALFGLDTGYILKDAIEAVCKSGIQRIRLGSLDPGIFNEEFISYLAENEKVCRHFHISLQSGSEQTLKDMGRNYTAKHYKKEVEIIRKYMPEAAISTDIMVGFAGETDELFAENLEFVKDIGFAKVHVFPYSIRPGTRAASYKGQLANAVKRERVAIMQDVGNKSRLAYIKSMVGEKVAVLLETADEDCSAEGYSREYIRAKVSGGSQKLGEIVEIMLDEDNVIVD